jgi:6,7-dimethyl-8-ribityllumazine synthase
MAKILIISSNIHKELSPIQLSGCETLLKNSPYDYEIEILEAGTYEIPFAINAYHQKKPFDAYIALGLVLNTNPAHYDYIMSHIKNAFSHFALNNILVGNGIVTASSVEELSTKITSQDPCLCAYPSAFKAVDVLIKLQQKLSPIAFNTQQNVLESF